MKYYIKDQGMTVKDAFTLPSKLSYDMDSVAEEAAEHFHDRHGGWECDWPITFTIVYYDGHEVDVTVEREYRPTFRAI